MTQTIIIRDGGFDKQFQIKKFGAMKFMFFTNQVLSMLAATDKINPSLIKQFINNKLSNGEVVKDDNGKDYDPQKVHEAVEKEMQENWIELAFDLIKSLLANIDQHQHAILNSILSCISYQNGSTLTQLSMFEGTDGYVDMIVDDGMNLYKLCMAVLEYNYPQLLKKKSS